MEFGNGKKNQLVWRSSENRYHNEEFKVNEDNDHVNVAILARQVMQKVQCLILAAVRANLVLCY